MVGKFEKKEKIMRCVIKKYETKNFFLKILNLKLK